MCQRGRMGCDYTRVVVLVFVSSSHFFCIGFFFWCSYTRLYVKIFRPLDVHFEKQTRVYI